MAGIINPGSPIDFQIQRQALERQRAIAQELQKQSMTPDQGQMVSGHYVAPSSMQYLAKLAQGLIGKSQQTSLDERLTALANSMTQERNTALEKYSNLLTGNPAVPGQNIGSGDNARQMSYMEHTGATAPEIIAPGQAAVAPNRMGALSALLNSKDPTLQTFGMQQFLKDPENSKWSTTPHYDQDGNAYLLNERGERKNLEGLKARDKMENINGVWQNPYAQGANTIAPADPNKPFSVGPDGPVPNLPYQIYAKDKAKAGAANVNVKTDVKLNEGIAAQVGPMMKDSVISATGAANQIDAAKRIIQAVDTNKVYAGPLASQRIKVAQISELIGAGGKDGVEKIANTRQIIRGLAEMTLEGRKKMHGQGQITETEGKLAEKANSGDIDELTPAEIKQLAKASERSARFIYADHVRKVDQMRKTPGLENVTPFYEVPSIAPEQAAQGGLSADEQQELQQLRQRLGRK